jgi:thiol-disulfide isomerase/thioredoxin
MNKNYIIAGSIAILTITSIFFLDKGALETVTGPDLLTTAVESGSLTTFAQCIKDSGALFYGAFWCSHCQQQKALFKSAEKELPYIECSTPDGQNGLPICAEAGIEGYPTWVFPDGSKLSGEQSFVNLAEKTGCTLPS